MKNRFSVSAKLCAAALVALLAACAPGMPGSTYNLGEARVKLVAYHDDGAYMRDFARVDANALDYITRRAPQVKKPAIVLDVDETSLSNWPQLQANGLDLEVKGPCSLPKGPCGFHAWAQRSADKPLQPTLDLFRAARKTGVTVFFITGRDETVRAATEKNLHLAGYRGWKKLILRPAHSKTPSAADYKVPERAKIEKMGYTIIANVGDQPSDLAGGHAERAYLVPNPFYRIP
ncbi:MAG: acid phosphatase [Alphaproteobacteria bacterium]|nr:acid phosphatase [Alphaproteobacteria bacterium]